MSKSTLSSVVSGLVRASMGSSVTSTVTDEDLDRHVAELILKEAKQKAERYGKEGYKAYLPNIPDSNVPRANKRFLSSIIRSTDDHNKTILRAQAMAVEEIKREREEQERQERRARAEEAVAAERMRRLMRGGRRRSESNSWMGDKERERKRRRRSWEQQDREEGDSDFDDERDRERGKRKEEDRHSRRRRHRSRSHSVEEDRERRNKRSRRDRYAEDHSGEPSTSEGRRHKSQSGSRAREGSRERDETSTSHSRGKSRRHDNRDWDRGHSHRSRQSKSPDRRRHSHANERRDYKRSKRTDTGSDEEDAHTQPKTCPPPTSEPLDTTDRELTLKQQLDDSRDNCDSNLHRGVTHGSSRLPTPIGSPRSATYGKPSSSSSPTSTPLIGPCRSPSPDPSTSQLPSKMDKYFEESYDPRLDVAPLVQPKVPATGLIDNAQFEGWDAMLELIRIRREDKAEKKRLERLGITKDKTKSSKSVSSGADDRWSGEAVNIMDIEYKKRGSVREWDLGKEGF